MDEDLKQIKWLMEVLKTPPVGRDAKREAGYLLYRLQTGESLGTPESKPIKNAGKRVRELRIKDAEQGLIWRIFYRVDPDAIVVVHWFAKKTRKTAQKELVTSKERLVAYDKAAEKGGNK